MDLTTVLFHTGPLPNTLKPNTRQPMQPNEELKNISATTPLGLPRPDRSPRLKYNPRHPMPLNQETTSCLTRRRLFSCNGPPHNQRHYKRSHHRKQVRNCSLHPIHHILHITDLSVAVSFAGTSSEPLVSDASSTSNCHSPRTEGRLELTCTPDLGCIGLLSNLTPMELRLVEEASKVSRFEFLLGEMSVFNS